VPNENAGVEALVLSLQGRVPNEEGNGCILCARILEDLQKNSKLTGGLLRDLFGQPQMPRQGQLNHIELEGFAIPPEI
jgi:hypothetical protein